MCLFYPSNHRIGLKISVSVWYILFALISIIPLFVDAIDHNVFGPWEGSDRKWAVALFGGGHSMFINPIVTILSITTLFAQVREILSQPSLRALSLVGLATQAVIFAIVAISWMMRVKYPWNVLDFLTAWYQLVGWAAVDNAVFAIVQAVLLLLALHHVGRHANKPPSGETEPLLGGQVSVEGGRTD
jgi:hypothetical protein